MVLNPSPLFLNMKAVETIPILKTLEQGELKKLVEIVNGMIQTEKKEKQIPITNQKLIQIEKDLSKWKKL